MNGGYCSFLSLLTLHNESLAQLTPGSCFSTRVAQLNVAAGRSTNWNISLDREESTHSQSKSINDKSRVEDPSFAVARIGAEYDTSSALMGDKMDALKAQQEAATQERIAQREALKARVARTKADEYKSLLNSKIFKFLKGLHL